jgi:hypothetical protein
MSRTVSILLALLPLSALAADWVRVDAADQNTHYYDRSKLGVDGDEITYWRRVVFRTPQPVKGGAARMAMYRERIDCARHTYRTLGYLLYAQDGSVLDNVYTPDATAAPIIPETVGDRFETLMCVFGDEARRARLRADAEPTPSTAAELQAQIDRLEANLRTLKEKLRSLNISENAASPQPAGPAPAGSPAGATPAAPAPSAPSIPAPSGVRTN